VPYCRVAHSDRKDTTGTGPTVWGRSLAVMTIPLRPVMMAWPSSSWVVPCRRGQQDVAVWGVGALTDGRFRINKQFVKVVGSCHCASERQRAQRWAILSHYLNRANLWPICSPQGNQASHGLKT
jgi:hypothetical protein